MTCCDQVQITSWSSWLELSYSCWCADDSGRKTMIMRSNNHTVSKPFTWMSSLSQTLKKKIFGNQIVFFNNENKVNCVVYHNIPDIPRLGNKVTFKYPKCTCYIILAECHKDATISTTWSVSGILLHYMMFNSFSTALNSTTNNNNNKKL